MVKVNCRTFVFLAAFFGSVEAQIYDVATSADGAVLALASTYHLPGDAAGTYSTILTYRDAKWSTAARAESYTTLYQPRMTGDGDTLLWLRSLPCGGSCMFAIPRSVAESKTIDIAALKIPTFDLTISRNGRYVYCPGYMSLPKTAGIQDLTTGEYWTDGIPTGGASIADDGTVVGWKPGGSTNLAIITRWRPHADPADLFGSDSIWTISQSADGHTALAVIRGATAWRIVRIDIDSGEQSEAGSVAYSKNSSVPLSVRPSGDGSRALLFMPNEDAPVRIWERSSTSISELELLGGVINAAISADGRIVFLIGRDNALTRIDLATGERTRLLPPFPSRLFTAAVSPVPGSAMRFWGTPVAGEHIWANDLEMPLLAEDDPQLTAAQVPWEFASRLGPRGFVAVDLTMRVDGHPFEALINTFFYGQPYLTFDTPSPAADGPGLVRAATANGTRIDAAHPAKPGETIRVWMTGLGALDTQVPTGAAGPADPPARPLAIVACAIMGLDFINPPWSGIEVRDVRYSPTRAGYYELDVTIPADWPAGMHRLACYLPATDGPVAGGRADARLPVGVP